MTGWRVAIALVGMCGGSFLLGYFRGERVTQDKLEKAYNCLRQRYDDRGIENWQLEEEIQELYMALFAAVSRDVPTAEPVDFGELVDDADFWKHGKPPPWESN